MMLVLETKKDLKWKAYKLIWKIYEKIQTASSFTAVVSVLDRNTPNLKFLVAVI